MVGSIKAAATKKEWAISVVFTRIFRTEPTALVTLHVIATPSINFSSALGRPCRLGVALSDAFHERHGINVSNCNRRLFSQFCDMPPEAHHREEIDRTLAVTILSLFKNVNILNVNNSWLLLWRRA